jgi:hypothetical protein
MEFKEKDILAGALNNILQTPESLNKLRVQITLSGFTLTSLTKNMRAE